MTEEIVYRKATLANLDEIFTFVAAAIEKMNAQGIYQWDDIYPQKQDFEDDIKNGWLNCEKLHQNVIDAVAEMGIATNVEYITDMAVVMSYNVMSTPIVVVNEQVASAGKVLSVGQIKEILANV